MVTQTKVVTLHLARSTPGTHVYTEASNAPRRLQTFPTIYVQRDRLPETPPAVLTVTLSWEEQ